MAQALDSSNCGIARSRGKEASVKPVSRRTEMPYKADEADKLAPHSEVRCSVPEVDGTVVQGQLTSLLREICSGGSPATAGATIRNGRRPGAEASRGRSTGSHEPGAVRPAQTKKPEGLTTREGLNLAGRSDHRWSRPRGDAERLSEGGGHRGRERALHHPSGLPGTAGRGPACPVVWGPGGKSPRLPDSANDTYSLSPSEPTLTRRGIPLKCHNKPRQIADDDRGGTRT